MENSMENKEYQGYGVFNLVELEDIDIATLQIAEVEIDAGLRMATHRT